MVRMIVTRLTLLLVIAGALFGGRYVFDQMQSERRLKDYSCSQSGQIQIIGCQESLSLQQRYQRYAGFPEKRISMESYSPKMIDLDSFYQQFEEIHNACLASKECMVMDGGARLKEIKEMCVSRGFEYCSNEAVNESRYSQADKLIIFKRAVMRQDEAYVINPCRLNLLEFYRLLPDEDKQKLHPQIQEKCERKLQMQATPS